jgi:hypothetical protein
MIARGAIPAVVTTALLLAAAGCDKVREKQAIRRYASGTAAANQQLRPLRALEAVLVERVKGGQPTALRAFLKERYLPAFAAYLEAVRAVPTGTDRLRAIHGAYVKALERAHEAHASFQEQLTAASLQPGWAEVTRAKLAQAAAEERYQQDIAAYYRENDVKVAGQ